MNELKLEVPKSTGNPVFVAVSEYRGQMRLDVREYYETVIGDQAPSKKGVNLPLADGLSLVSAIEEVLNGRNRVDVDAELRNPLKVSIGEYRGKNLIDVRHYYDAGGVWKPTKKGISFLSEDGQGLLATVAEMVARCSSPLWFFV